MARVKVCSIEDGLMSLSPMHVTQEACHNKAKGNYCTTGKRKQELMIWTMSSGITGVISRHCMTECVMVNCRTTHNYYFHGPLGLIEALV